MALSRRFGHGVMSLSSHASDGTAEVTWSCCDVGAESYWSWCSRVDLVVERCRCRVMLVAVLPSRLGLGVMSLSSHTGNGAAESC
jgi:hypothetical protein